jgi:hypothetical protein
MINHGKTKEKKKRLPHQESNLPDINYIQFPSTQFLLPYAGYYSFSESKTSQHIVEYSTCQCYTKLVLIYQKVQTARVHLIHFEVAEQEKQGGKNVHGKQEKRKYFNRLFVR